MLGKKGLKGTIKKGPKGKSKGKKAGPKGKKGKKKGGKKKREAQEEDPETPPPKRGSGVILNHPDLGRLFMTRSPTYKKAYLQFTDEGAKRLLVQVEKGGADKAWPSPPTVLPVPGQQWKKSL